MDENHQIQTREQREKIWTWRRHTCGVSTSRGNEDWVIEVVDVMVKEDNRFEEDGDTVEEQRVNKGNTVKDEKVEDGGEEEVVDGNFSGDDYETIMDDGAYELKEELAGNGVNVEEEEWEDMGVHFGDVRREDDAEVSDVDSGDDIWDDDKIPDPLSSDDDEEAEERREIQANNAESGEFLALGKTTILPQC